MGGGGEGGGRLQREENVVLVQGWVRELRRGESIRGNGGGVQGKKALALVFKRKLVIFLPHAHVILFII